MWTETAEKRKAIIDHISSSLVESYMHPDYKTTSPGTTDSSRTMSPNFDDGVCTYATNLLTLGCFYMEFRDAIKEGDSLRDLRCYRYMLPMFLSSGRTNYSIETLNLLLQHDFLSSPRFAEELLWGRFINTHVQPGKNIPNDLHCEHLNGLCKNSISHLGANKTESAICQVAQALGTIQPVLNGFGTDNSVNANSSLHPETSSEKDFKMILEVLQRQSVFERKSNRKHCSFSNPSDPLHVKPQNSIIEWTHDHAKCYFDK